MKVTLNKTRVADAIRRCASVANAGKMGAISGKIRVVATLDSVEFAATVRAAACVADAKRPSVWLRLADGKLTAETTGAEIGASRITQAVDYRGEPFEVEFDSRFLLGFFGVLPSATPLSYWHGGEKIALFETSDGKISFVCLPLQPPQNKEKRR